MVDSSAPLIIIGLLSLLLVIIAFSEGRWKSYRPVEYGYNEPIYPAYPVYNPPYYPYWDTPYYDGWYGSDWLPWNWFGHRDYGSYNHGGRHSSRYSPQYQLARGGGGLNQRGPGWTKAQIKNAGAAWSHARANLKVIGGKTIKAKR